MENILTVENLQKAYGKKIVVKDISLSIKSKQIIGLLGPNGAGKTTAFYMIVGLIQADSGLIKLNGENISDLAMHQRANLGIGYLPQEASIFRKLTVAENIMAILELRKDLSQEQRKNKLNALLQEFHIEHIKDNYGMTLSGGERRRAEIARALALDPKFILLDEPFAGVDPISVIDIKNIIHHLQQRNIGILITDHNVRETLDICEHAYIVGHGEIICQGTPKEVLQNQKVKEVYLGHEFDL